jgi:hypothetical protein
MLPWGDTDAGSLNCFWFFNGYAGGVDVFILGKIIVSSSDLETPSDHLPVLMMRLCE